MSEITALPGLPVPGSDFRRDQPVIYRGDEMLFMGMVDIPLGKFRQPLAILWHGGGRCFARIEEVSAPGYIP